MKTDPRHDHGRGHDNDNDHGEIVSSPARGALTSLAALQTALNNVDTSSVAGRSGLPMLSFKREGDGTWMYGQRQTFVESDSRWAVNPLSFQWGFIAFNDNKVAGERLVSISLPKPEITELPNKGDAEWTEQWTVNLKCLDGADAGTEVIFKPTTVGGIQAVAGMVEAVRDRLNGGQHDGKVAPVVQFAKASYQHGQFGKVWTPVLQIIEWMAIDGPAPPASAPDPTPPPPEQPRRRRVA
jgi:hypothetical protein